MNDYSPFQATVLVPAFNEEHFLRSCLGSIVDQADCIIIGDNASTDGTETICREFAEKYKHIQYIRRETNVGAVENIVRLADLVETEYVLQMGAHDVLAEHYIATLKNQLNANADAVCAYGNCSYLELDGTISQTRDFASVRSGMLDDDPYVRAAAFFLGKQPCDLIFGLYRSSTAVPVLTKIEPIAGCDHIIPVVSLLDGKFIYASDTVYFRRMAHPKDTDKAYMERIVGANSANKVSRDYTVAGRQLHDLVWQHRKQQTLSCEREKAFKILLFQLALKFNTPIGNPFWDTVFFLRSHWKRCCKALKYKFLPGYARKKGL